MNLGFSRTRCCLSRSPRDWPERVTDVHDKITDLHNCPGQIDFNHKGLGEMLISRCIRRYGNSLGTGNDAES